MQKEYFHTYHTLATHYPDGEAQALARWIMEIRFGMDRLKLCLGANRPFTEEERKELDSIISRLLKDEPLQYILGCTDFCGNTLTVEPGALIPRPETEELTDWIVSDASKSNSRILDIGTGSGCIAVTLAGAFPESQVTAIDISSQALAVARKNAARTKANIKFVLCDITNEQAWPQIHPETQPGTPTWDIIVSNPPYICRSEAREMQANVLDYEPYTALFVEDDDPLVFYRAIARYARSYLNPNGRLYLEINRRFGKETVQLLKDSGFRQIELRKDFRENDRMIRCRL